jgi:hypothetical protein
MPAACSRGMPPATRSADLDVPRTTGRINAGAASVSTSGRAAVGPPAAVSSHGVHLHRSRTLKLIRTLPALVLVAALSVVSCTSGDDGPAGPSSAAAPELATKDGLLGTGIGNGLLACDPLPYARTQASVGANGGALVVGPHVLTIPAGALAQPVVITAEAPVGTVNSVRLEPEGLQFAAGKPAELTLSYANCPLLGKLLPKRVAYTTDLLQILSYVLSIDDLLHQRVTGSLQHFSRYAVAW